MSDKSIACRCEDVSAKDIRNAVEKGHRDFEGVKRYTGFGTGWCQGKQCVALCARLVVEAGGKATSPITPRPPLHPIALADLAAIDEAEEPTQ